MVLFANMGVPMIAIYFPAAWLALTPIILLEAWIGVRMLRTTFGTSLKAAAVGNIASTLLGIRALFSFRRARPAGGSRGSVPAEPAAD